MEPPDSLPKLGIIAGGGVIPLLVAKSAIASGREVHIIGISGEAEESIKNFPHSWTKWGQVGRLFNILESEKCQDVVIVGSVSRPDFSQFKFDFGAIMNLPFILSLTIGGDDHILSGIVKFFEDRGFSVKGAHEIAPNLIAPKGTMGLQEPSTQDREDIELGFRVIEALGQVDVGQAAVVSRGYVLGVEAAEGTDALVERCAELKQWGNKFGPKTSGVLVKGPKPSQEKRIDMPTIGPRTLETASKANLSGIAFRSGGVLLIERDKLIALADQKGLFLIGIPALS